MGCLWLSVYRCVGGFVVGLGLSVFWVGFCCMVVHLDFGVGGRARSLIFFCGCMLVMVFFFVFFRFGTSGLFFDCCGWRASGVGFW